MRFNAYSLARDLAAQAHAWLRKPGRIARRAGYAALMVVAACATASVPATPPPPAPVTPLMHAREFTLQEPQPGSLGPDLKLWATHYHTPVVSPAPETISAAMALIDRSNREISPKLRVRDWCQAALQGTVSVVEANGTASAYAFADSGGPEQANCDQWLGNLSDGIKLATRKARFFKVNYPYGCGVRDIPLMPFRTIAVDPDVIPVGSVIYVPELRGKPFRFLDRSWNHDGYLFAGDRGGAITGAHIDVFHGNTDQSPFEDLFASTSSRRFEAHKVRADDPAAAALMAAQAGHCDAVTR
jgi:3D (Asp-Asp-Asp) domain-containing protein